MTEIERILEKVRTHHIEKAQQRRFLEQQQSDLRSALKRLQKREAELRCNISYSEAEKCLDASEQSALVEEHLRALKEVTDTENKLLEVERELLKEIPELPVEGSSR